MLAGEEREEGQRERRGDVLFSGWAEFGCLLTLLASGFGAGCRYSRGTNNTRRLALTGVTGPQGPWLTAWLGLRGMPVSRGGLHKSAGSAGLGVPYLGRFGAVCGANVCRKWSRFGLCWGFGTWDWVRGCVGIWGWGKRMGPKAEYEVPFLALAVQNAVPEKGRIRRTLTLMNRELSFMQRPGPCHGCSLRPTACRQQPLHPPPLSPHSVPQADQFSTNRDITISNSQLPPPNTSHKSGTLPGN